MSLILCINYGKIYAYAIIGEEAVMMGVPMTIKRVGLNDKVLSR